MKSWFGKDLCAECAGKLGATLEVGRPLKGRCHRCHSEQTLFKVIRVSATPPSNENVCPECAHPIGTHALSCRQSELKIMQDERREIVELLQEYAGYDPEHSLADQLRRIFQQLHK